MIERYGSGSPGRRTVSRSAPRASLDGMAEKTWFITGTSRGFGREWTRAALERGDRVAATARDPATLDDLVPSTATRSCPWRSTSPTATRSSTTVGRAHEHFGRLDIVVNNAGYGQFGMVEELSEQEARDQIETNLFGALWVTQAALPFLREQGSGPLPPGVLHRRHLRVPGHRHVPRLQVGARGHQPGARPGDQGLRDPRHADRARRLLDRLGRLVGPARGAARRLRADARGVAATRAPATRPATRPPRRRPSCASSTPTSRRCARSSAARRSGVAEKDYEGRLETWREWQPVAEIAQGAPT